VTNPFENGQALAAWLAATDIDLLELKGPTGTLRLTRSAGNVVSERVEEPSDFATVVVRATGVGIFLDRHPLRLQPQAPVGAEVEAGAPIGFLRIGPVVTAIAAPSSGIVTDVLVRNGVAVGFATPLFELQQTGSESEP
jgi:acetyl-CoA carboxylase biotin carboxyl carrier protein